MAHARRSFLSIIPLGLVFAYANGASGETRAPSAIPTVASDSGLSGLYDEIWALAEIYVRESNPVLQSFKLVGRIQLDYARVDAEEGNYNDFLVRRFRFGFKSKLFQDLTIHVEGDFDIQGVDPFYNRLTDTYVAWTPNSCVKLKVGKQSAPFTLDGATTSKELITIDRNNLSNNLGFTQEYIPGVTVSGKIDPWRYMAGVYSAGSASREFGDFEGGLFFLVSLGYDFSQVWGVDEARVSFNYVYQDPDEKNTFTRPHEHVASLNFSYNVGQWGFRSDFAGSRGYGGQGDLFGVVAMPFYNVNDRLQIVGRYTYLSSSEENTVQPARYESRIVSGRGDAYNEIYLGLNWFLYGHKLKLQTGVKYAVMNDRAGDGGEYDGWGWTTALRLSW